VEKHRQPDGSIRRLETVNQWNMVRDGYTGAWKYNPEARSTTWSGLPEENAIDAAGWITRENPRHVDRLGLMKFIRQNLSEKDWDYFIELYGIANGVVTMPANVPQDKEAEYVKMAKEVAEGNPGALPNGAQYTPNNLPHGGNIFRPRLDYLTEKMILAGTGGLLTMLTQSGSGTLAGNAHQETFEKLARAEAQKISEIFNQAIDVEVLAREFPGKPVLVYFELAANDELDPDKIVDHAVKLAQAGYKMDVAQLAEKTGYTLSEAPPAQPGAEPILRNRAPGRKPSRAADPEGLGKLLARGREVFGEALAGDLQPFREALSRVLAADDDQFESSARALYEALPQLEAQIIRANGSTDALEKILGSAAAAGLQVPAATKNRNPHSKK
jgi:phage gp29-like protein